MSRTACLPFSVFLAAALWAAQAPPTTSPDPSAQPSGSTSSAAAPAQAAQPAQTPGAAPGPNLLGEARAMVRSGDFDGALAKYKQILEQSPNSPDAHAGVIRTYLKKKDAAGAVQAAKAAEPFAKLHTVKTAIGELHFRQGEISQAEREWVEVINSGYPDARAYLGLSRVRTALSMYKSAWKMVDKAHEIDPTDPDIQRAWIATLSVGERIKYLEIYLSSPNGEDPEERWHTQHYLDYLKARLGLPKRGCRLVSQVSATETPLVRLLQDMQHLRGYGLTVAVNGNKTNLRLDTGASGILINRSFAEKAGITKLSDSSVSGIGDKGGKPGYLAMADSIKIGELEFQNCPVEVIDSRSVVEEQGLIGSDVFSRFLVDIDFPNEKFKLSELPKRPDEPPVAVALSAGDAESSSEDAPADETHNAAPKPAAHPEPKLFDRYIAPEMKSYTQVFRFGHQLLVPTHVGDLPVAKLFLLDTGGFNNLISTAAAGEVTKVHTDTTIVKGISGSVKNVYRADKAVLEFGHLRQQNEDIVAFDLTPISNSTGTEISGILGFAMLRLLDIKIDYRDGLVDFGYDAKRWGQ